jgi:aspartate aminotransferase-like enzyme
MIGHRGQGFKDLYAKIQPQLQQLLGTKQLVYISTSSAWGVMEGALRNLVAKKVLNCMCGACSDKWFDVSKRCAKEAEALQVPWGAPIRAADVDKKLAAGQFDALTVIHNETSTGVMSPIAEIAALKRKYPDVMFIVDSVSSMSAVPLKFDELGIDVLLAGTQKAFALPPGTALFVCSPAALAKAATMKDRGYYFDLVEFQKNAEQNMTHPQHPEHRPRLCARIQAARHLCRGPGSPLRPPSPHQPVDPRLGRQTRLHPVPRKGLRVHHPHLHQQRRETRRAGGGRAQAAEAG